MNKSARFRKIKHPGKSSCIPTYAIVDVLKDPMLATAMFPHTTVALYVIVRVVDRKPLVMLERPVRKRRTLTDARTEADSTHIKGTAVDVCHISL